MTPPLHALFPGSALAAALAPSDALAYADVISALRRRSGLAAASLNAAARLPEGSVESWEQGDGAPTVADLAALAAAVGGRVAVVVVMPR